MLTELLPRIDYALSQHGALYHGAYTLADTLSTNAILLPITKIYALGIQIPELDKWDIYVTMGTKEEIEADTAVWVKWDGSALINLAATAIYGTNISGGAISTLSITVKGDI